MTLQTSDLTSELEQPADLTDEQIELASNTADKHSQFIFELCDLNPHLDYGAVMFNMFHNAAWVLQHYGWTHEELSRELANIVSTFKETHEE